MKNLITLGLLFAFAISFSQNAKTLQYVNITDDIDTCENLPIQLIVEFIDYDSLQWQLSSGSGFVNVIDGAIYTGSNNDTLSFTTSMIYNNYQYRCVAYNFTDNDSIFSPVINLNIENIYPEVWDSYTNCCYGDSVALSFSGLQTIVSCLWSTGENYYPIFVNPSDTETYTVTATNLFGCTSTDSTIVNVIYTNSEFDIVEDTICQFSDINIIAESSYAESYYTIFEGNTVENSSNNILINTLMYGTDTVSLYIFKNGCYSDTTSHIITSLYNEVNITQSVDTIFASHSQSYQWYYYDTLLIGETDSFLVISETGEYQVFTSNSNVCTNSNNIYISILEIDSVWASPNEICLGESATLMASTPDCITKDFNDGTIGSGWSSNVIPDLSNPCLPPVDGTTYFWIGDDACFPRDLTTINMDITGGTEICFDFVMAIQGDMSPCEGPDEMDEGVSFQYSTDNGISWHDITYFCPDGNQYSTNSWAGSSSSGTSGPTAFTEWGNYCYTVPSGAVSPTTMFQWHQEQVTSQTYDHWGLDNISFCSLGQTTTNNVNWYDEQNNLITSYNNTVYPTQTTTYMGVLSSATGVSDTAYIDVIVNPLPEPDIFQTFNTINTNYFETYQWYKNNLQISGANDYFYNANYSGSFFVEVTDTNGCVGYSDTIYVTVTSVNELGSNNIIKIYPNPASNFITVENKDIILNSIEISDLSGRVFIKKVNNTKAIKLDITDLKKGTYFIKINDFNESIKFIKE